jgi:hypothetical protein
MKTFNIFLIKYAIMSCNDEIIDYINCVKTRYMMKLSSSTEYFSHTHDQEKTFLQIFG